MENITYEIGLLSKHYLRLKVRAFCIKQSGKSYYGDGFDVYAKRGGVFCAALHDGNVVGCTSSVPTKDNKVIADVIGAKQWLLDNGYTLEETDYPAMTYVDPAYRGHGVAKETHRLKFQHQIDSGFKQTLNFAFETQSARDYYAHLGNLHDTGLPHYYDQPIFLTPLEDALASVS